MIAFGQRAGRTVQEFLRRARFLTKLMPLCIALLLPLLAASAEQSKTVVVLDIEGPIGPAATDYVQRGLAEAEEQGATAAVLRIDTPGGLDESMREIVQHILASSVPVIAYVAPRGARAASAGTYILYASHVAAMAPGTSVGAATPVQIGGLTRPMPRTDSQPSDEGGETQPAAPPHPTVADKAVSDAIAYIRSLAQMRGRNADWAERAVREAASLSAQDALAEGVIDIVADDLDDLLAQVDGRRVDIMGETLVLQTADATVVALVPDWRTKLLAIIANPNVAYILMLIGLYGILFEFYSPGLIFPGVIGGISLLLALYAFQILPVDYTGLGLIALGIALMIGEVFAPSFGALGLGGIAAFVIGSVMLMDTDVPGFRVSPVLIGTIATLGGGLFLTVVTLMWKARRRAVTTGPEEMLSSTGEVVAWAGNKGRVRVHGEIWRARGAKPLRRGQKIEVAEVDGLTLVVNEAPEKEP